MIPVCMTAAPRRQPLAGKTLASLRRAGFADITISAEPGTEIQTHGLAVARVNHSAEQLGEWRNFLRAAELLLTQSRQPYLMTCQDDVLFCRGTAVFMESAGWPGDQCGCLMIYTSAFYDEYPTGQRSKLHPEHALDMLGACALLFSRAALACLLDWGREKGWRGDPYGVIEEPHMKKAADTFIGEVLTVSGFDIWIHNPSLAQHVGEESTLGHVGDMPRRTALHWPGEDSIAAAHFERHACTL